MVNRESILEYECCNENCNQKHHKKLKDLIKNNSFICLQCTKVNSLNKRVKTNLKLYGKKYGFLKSHHRIEGRIIDNNIIIPPIVGVPSFFW